MSRKWVWSSYNRSTDRLNHFDVGVLPSTRPATEQITAILRPLLNSPAPEMKFPLPMKCYYTKHIRRRSHGPNLDPGQMQDLRNVLSSTFMLRNLDTRRRDSTKSRKIVIKLNLPRQPLNRSMISRVVFRLLIACILSSYPETHNIHS